jgi:2-amino-4-hydroxy-6-hydroxymethyldihydropteridine diphosphokinase
VNTGRRLAAPVLAAVGLGGNVGDVAATLREALQALDALPGTEVLRGSPLYRTPAWGNTGQPDFINAAALLRTTLDARALLDGLLDIERRFGRDRGADSAQWGPRTLDLDLLLHGESVADEAGLRVPHPHLHERAFVLVPLARIAPRMRVPGHGAVEELLAAVDASGCVPLAAASRVAGAPPA